ncbi:aminopeptidase, partial [Streptomyces brasiliscabiei]
MNEVKLQLFAAEQKAKALFEAIEEKGLIIAGKSEEQLCNEIIEIAKNDFGAENHWGKKIVRAG